MPSRVVKGGHALTQYLMAAKSPEPMYAAAQQHVLNKASEPSGRRLDVMHPSEMIKTDWCHRAAFHRLVQNAEAPGRDKTTFIRENIFQEGHQVHSKWQRWFMEMNMLAGDWWCRSCDNVWWEDSTPEQCPHCQANVRCIEYAEVPLNGESIRVGGKSDGYCPRHNCLLEIKTLGLGSLRYESPSFLERYEVAINEEMRVTHDLTKLWRDFRRPLPSAVRQGQLYMYLARHFEDLEVDRMQYIYEFKPTQDVKAFTVLYDEKMSEPLIDAAEAIVDCVAADSPPFCNNNGRAGCPACRPFEEKK